MSIQDGFDEFIRAYPKYRRQRIAHHAYEFAMTRTTHDELMTALRRFAAVVEADRPQGDAWRYCVTPARWLQEERWIAYLEEQL